MALQIKGKFIEESAIDGEKLQLSSGQAVKIVKADGTTVVRLIELDEVNNKVLVDGVAVALEPALLAEIQAREDADTALSAAIQAAIQAEAESRVAADNTLQDNIDAEAAARAGLESSLDAEVARATGAETALQTALTAEESARQAADTALSGRLDIIEGPETQAGSIAKALKDAKDYVNDVIGVSSAAVSAFASLAEQMTDGNAATGVIDALGSLETRLDVIEGDATVEGSVAKAESDANAYADAAVLVEKNRAEAAEALLTSNLAAEVARATTAESGLASDIAAEETRALTAEGALSGRVDVLEGRLHRKPAKFVITQADLDAGFIELPHQAMENSIVASVGRLMIHEGVGEDYTVSVVDGKSRMTFVGNLVDPSEEKLEVGDVIYVKYMNV